jgi:septal ring factor EnvC (AmiA/AmiB activator)
MVAAQPALTQSALAQSALAQSALAQSRPQSDLERQREAERLREVERSIERDRGRQASLERQSQMLGREVETLQIDIVTAARAVQTQEDELSSLERKLDALAVEEQQKSGAFARQRDRLGWLTNAMQNLARHPPETMLAAPGNPVDTVRSAILLQTALPRVQLAVAQLRGDLERLSVLRDEVIQQAARVEESRMALVEQHRRLEGLVRRKAALQERTESESLRLAQRVQAMAATAQDLRQLLEKLEQERLRREAEERARAIEAQRQAQQQAQRLAQLEAQRQAQRQAQSQAQAPAPTQSQAQPPPAARTPGPSTDQQVASLPIPAGPGKPGGSGKPGELAQPQGQLAYPASGRVQGRYGEADEHGATQRGLTIETRAGAQVVATYGGTVAFAGQFRGYGQLLIIEHGEGYHSLLAGLGRIDARVGQSVVAGEPVGIMAPLPGQTPKLYVEFRRNGQPVNPLPWLAAGREKVSG